MDVYQLYKPFRNALAQFAIDDSLYVIWAYSQLINDRNFQFPSNIEIAPNFFNKEKTPLGMIFSWELELLAKEILLNSNIVAKKQNSLRKWRSLAKMIKRLRSLENKIYGLRKSGDKVLIELIRMAHRQFIWQENGKPNASTLIRYFKIYNQPAINQVCINRLGLTIEEIFRCGIAFFAEFSSHPFKTLPVTSDIPGITSTVIERFLNFTCRSLDDLKYSLEATQAYDDRFAYAYHELRAFPIIKMRIGLKDALACPMPILLFWRITNGLFYELVDDPRFGNPFGASFQMYIGEAIEKTCTSKHFKLLSEQSYGTKKSRKDPVDWILIEANSALFIECKAKRLSWSAKSISLDDTDPLNSDIDAVAQSVLQIYKSIEDYRQNKYSHLNYDPKLQVFPIVVTLENLFLSGPEAKKRLNDLVRKKLLDTKISTNILDEIPFSICSCQELESGLKIIADIGIKKFLKEKCDDPEKRAWEWHSYIVETFPNHSDGTPQFSDEIDALFDL